MRIFLFAVFAIPFFVWGCFSVSESAVDDLESSSIQCQDNTDNDDDGLTDCGDPGCGQHDFCGDEDSDSNSQGGLETDSGEAADTDTQVGVEMESDIPGEGEECTIMIAGAIPMTGTCGKGDPCEGGYASELPVEMGATQDCLVGVDCCADTGQCVALKETLEAALGVTPSCKPETGNGACKQEEGLYNFQVGCPADTPNCCLEPLF